MRKLSALLGAWLALPSLLVAGETTTLEFYVLDTGANLAMHQPETPGTIYVSDGEGFSQRISLDQQPVRIPGVPTDSRLRLEAVAYDPSVPSPGGGYGAYLLARTQVKIPSEAGSDFYLPHLHLKAPANPGDDAPAATPSQPSPKASASSSSSTTGTVQLVGQVLDSHGDIPQDFNPQVPDFVFVLETGQRSRLGAGGTYEFRVQPGERLSVLAEIYNPHRPNRAGGYGVIERGVESTRVHDEDPRQVVFPIQTRIYLP